MSVSSKIFQEIIGEVVREKENEVENLSKREVEKEVRKYVDFDQQQRFDGNFISARDNREFIGSEDEYGNVIEPGEGGEHQGDIIDIWFNHDLNKERPLVELSTFKDTEEDNTNLEKIISDYEAFYNSPRHEDEEYKWSHVDHFQEEWPEIREKSGDEFVEALMSSIEKGKNLIGWRSRERMRDVLEERPEEAREAVIELLEGDDDIYDRIDKFFEVFYRKHRESSDRRGTSFLLASLYPERFIHYKYTEFKEFFDEFDLKLENGFNSDDRVQHYLDVNEKTKEILEEITVEDKDLWHVQDLIYFYNKYWLPEEIKEELDSIKNNAQSAYGRLFALRHYLEMKEDDDGGIKEDDLKSRLRTEFEGEKTPGGDKSTYAGNKAIHFIDNYDLFQKTDGVIYPTEKSENYISAMKHYADYLWSKVVGVNYWQMAPGRKAKNWDKMAKEGIMSIKFEEFPDLSNVESKDELKEIAREVHPDWSSGQVNSYSSILWRFLQAQEGDKIVANRGKKKLAGVGTVERPYYYYPESEDHPHRLDVNWFETEERRIPNWQRFEGKFGRTTNKLSREEFDELMKSYEDSEPNIWVEKSHHDREKRQEGERKVGKALWAPQKKKNGHKSVYYDNLKDVEPGDIILHLDQDSREIVGVSKAQSEYEETQVLENTEWDDVGVREMDYKRGERPCYLVKLDQYKELDQSLPVDKILRDENEGTLDEILENYSGLVFNKNYNLNQGAYLTKAPHKLVQLIQSAYNEETGEQIPFIEVEGMSSDEDSKPSLIDGPDIDVNTPLDIDLSENLLEQKGLYFPNDQGGNIVSQIQAALNSGKHIIFTGPPGTGKTEIAEAVASKLKEEDENVTDFEMTTATADWSTFDTVGGFMPEKNGEGELEFNSGQVLNRFKDDYNSVKNELLIIDEINRSDIDKAFGQLFTLLSGQRVQLPYTADNDEEIEVIPGDEAPEAPEEHQYVMPESWRILGTMNSYDKTSLYEMSYAFMRRFAFIRVDAPEEELRDEIEEYNSHWGIEAEEDNLDSVADIWERINSAVDGRKIGPAIAEDMLGFVSEGSSSTSAVINFVFPQLEGVRNNDDIVREITKSEHVDETKLRKTAQDMLQVKFDEEE